MKIERKIRKESKRNKNQLRDRETIVELQWKQQCGVCVKKPNKTK